MILNLCLAKMLLSEFKVQFFAIEMDSRDNAPWSFTQSLITASRLLLSLCGLFHRSRLLSQLEPFYDNEGNQCEDEEQ